MGEPPLPLPAAQTGPAPADASLLSAAQAARAASADRVVLFEHEGRRWVLKRVADRPRNAVQSLMLRAFIKLLVGQAPGFRSLRLAAGANGKSFEADRLSAFARAGVAVPAVAHRGDDFLVLQYCGHSLANLLQGWSVAECGVQLTHSALQLAEFHRAGHWHGAAQIKNLTRLGALDYRIDFEESFGEAVPLAVAQAFDLMLFLNSISLRGPIDEAAARSLLPLLLDTYLRSNPDKAVPQVFVRALPWVRLPVRLAAAAMRVIDRRGQRQGAARLLILADVLAAHWPRGGAK